MTSKQQKIPQHNIERMLVVALDKGRVGSYN